MAVSHSFLFTPGNWVGEGTVTFSASPEQLYFITKWAIHSSGEEGIACNQEVRMEGTDEPVLNYFKIFDLTPTNFKISLKNDILGEVSGTGIIDKRTIAWEFRGQIGFQGYEVYEMEGEGLYKFHAEYASPDQFRTIIDGHIRLTF
jgi:hypothetical protein